MIIPVVVTMATSPNYMLITGLLKILFIIIIVVILWGVGRPGSPDEIKWCAQE
jgi:hypothetical protein